MAENKGFRLLPAARKSGREREPSGVWARVELGEKKAGRWMPDRGWPMADGEWQTWDGFVFPRLVFLRQSLILFLVDFSLPCAASRVLREDGVAAVCGGAWWVLPALGGC